MAYSTSKKTLEKIRPMLSEVEAGKDCVLESSMPSHKLAYKIREALHIARLHPKEFEALAKAATTHTVEILNVHQVQVRKRAVEGMVVQHGTELAGMPHTRDGKQSAASIVQAWHDVQPSNDKLYFPQAMLVPDELKKLYAWCQKRQPKWVMFESDGAVTLQPYERGIEEVSWNPSDLQK